MAYAISRHSGWSVALLVLVVAGCASNAPASKLKDVATAQDNAAKAYVDGNLAQAAADYQRITHMAPGDADAWFRLGNVYARQEQLDAAEQAYQQALRFDPHNAKAWHNLGLVRLRLSAASFAHSEQAAGGADPVLQKQSEQYVHGISQLDGAMHAAQDDAYGQLPASSASVAQAGTVP